MRWEKKRPLSFFIVLTVMMLGLGMMLGLVRPVNAYTNTFTGLGNTSCTNVCTNPITVAGTIATSNDILVSTIQCVTPNAVLSITDTKGGGWASANARTIPTQNGAANPDGATNSANSANSMAAIWFSSPETSGAVTITITFTQTNTYCIASLLEGNTPSIAVNTGAFSVQQFSEPSTSANSVLSQVTTNYPTVPDNSIVLFFAGGIGTNANHAMNGVSVDPPAATVSGPVGNALGQTFVSSSSQVNNGATYNHFCCSGVGNYDTDFLMSAVFAQQGTLPGKPASSYILGCTTAGTGTYTIDGNSTVYYPVWGTSNSASIMSNVTVDVKAVALTNGQTSAFLQVGEYFSSSNSNVPFGQGPSQPDGGWFLVGNQAIILTNSATAKNYTFNVQGAAPGIGRAAAIGVWVSHNGITLRGAKAVSQNMYYDNGTLAYKTLTQFNAASSNACFGAKISTGASQETFTFTTVQGTTTVTQATGTVTLTVTSTQTTFDVATASATLPGELMLVLLVLGPALALAAVTKSFWGAMFGALIGTAIGATPPPAGPGIIPFWFMGVVVLGCLLLLFMAPKGGQGGSL